MTETYERHEDSSGTITRVHDDGRVERIPLPALWHTGQVSESFRLLGLDDRGGGAYRAPRGTSTHRMNEDQITRADRDERH